MRRGCRCLLSLILAIGALAACGDDSGSSSAPTTTATTTTGPTTTALEDPSGAVDEFCAQADEIEAIARGPQPTTPEQGQRSQELISEMFEAMQVLRTQTAAMVPGDVTRFEECASMFNIQQE